MARALLGFEELDRKFAALSRETQGKELERAAHEGMDVIREAAETLAPRRTGLLAQNLDQETVQAIATAATIHMAPEGDAWYGILQEIGTEHHPAQPFMRPAFDATKGDATDAVGAALLRNILGVARG